MIKIEIDTDNAAFGESEREKLAEAAMVLYDIAADMNDGRLGGTYKDMNGNTVCNVCEIDTTNYGA